MSRVFGASAMLIVWRGADLISRWNNKWYGGCPCDVIYECNTGWLIASRKLAGQQIAQQIRRTLRKHGKYCFSLSCYFFIVNHYRVIFFYCASLSCLFVLCIIYRVIFFYCASLSCLFVLRIIIVLYFLLCIIILFVCIVHHYRSLLSIVLYFLLCIIIVFVCIVHHYRVIFFIVHHYLVCLYCASLSFYIFYCASLSCLFVLYIIIYVLYFL